jgi:hypothetical protein
MKPRILILRGLPALLLPLVVAGTSPALAAPRGQPDKPVEVAKSIFIYPSSPKQGRDPFFPRSTRPYIDNPVTLTNSAPKIISSLTLKSILGDGPQALAIINNHAFAEGDEGEVTTSEGRRLHIRLLEIKLKTKSAIVEVGGQNIELHLEEFNP